MDLSDAKRALEIHDELFSGMQAVRAIADAAAVLSALERTPELATAGLNAIGGGFADGYQVTDDTLPVLLKHAANLVRSMEKRLAEMPLK